MRKVSRGGTAALTRRASINGAVLRFASAQAATDGRAGDIVAVSRAQAREIGQTGIIPGSTTDRVLRVLRELRTDNPLGAARAEDLRLLCLADRGGVAWAVRYLREHGLIETVTDDRNPRYLRYRALA